MFQETGWLVEALEARRMLSHHSSAVAAPISDSQTQTPVVSVKRRHRAAAPAVFQVAGGLGGAWSGAQQTPGSSPAGTVSLNVYLYGTAQSYAILTFTRPGGQVVTIQSQFIVSADGHFSLQAISGKMALKFSGTIFNHMTRTSQVATMNGTLQYWDRHGMYKSDVVITKA